MTRGVLSRISDPLTSRFKTLLSSAFQLYCAPILL